MMRGGVYSPNAVTRVAARPTVPFYKPNTLVANVPHAPLSWESENPESGTMQQNSALKKGEGAPNVALSSGEDAPPQPLSSEFINDIFSFQEQKLLNELLRSQRFPQLHQWLANKSGALNCREPMDRFIPDFQRLIDTSACCSCVKNHAWTKPRVVAVYGNYSVDLTKSFSTSVMSMKRKHDRNPVKALDPPIKASQILFPLPESFCTLNCVCAFHGAEWSNSDAITRDGFDERRADKYAHYGTGCYFTPESCKAMQYARGDDCKQGMKKSTCKSHYCMCNPDANGMIRQRLIYGPVLLGKPHYADGPLRGKTMPPEGCDSIVANRGTNNIFSPTGHQCHREFIEWNRNGACALPLFVVEIEYYRCEQRTKFQ
jgi:hypothetical protein